LDNLLNSVAV